jgi:Arm DNA-binding domain
LVFIDFIVYRLLRELVEIHVRVGVMFGVAFERRFELPQTMPLTDTAIRRATAKNKPYKLFDSGGLFLLVTPAGGKWWRFKYRFNNKEKLLSLGTYPDISLKAARDRRDQERRKLVDRIDPAV